MAFWNREGECLSHEGKDYGFGAELPASLGKERIAELVKSGAATEKFAAAVPSDEKDQMIATLTEANRKLQDMLDAGNNGDQQAIIDDLNNTIIELQQQIAAQTATITALTAAAPAADATAAAPAADATAGPKAGGKNK